MADQLLLIDLTDVPNTRQDAHDAGSDIAGSDIARTDNARTDNGWQLDAATCEIGRRGVAAARRALRLARLNAVPSIVEDEGFQAAA